MNDWVFISISVETSKNTLAMLDLSTNIMMSVGSDYDSYGKSKDCEQKG